MNPDTHLFLYAKGHYQRKGALLNDLARIIEARNTVPAEYVSVVDIQNILFEIVYDLMLRSGNPEYYFVHFVEDIMGKRGGEVIRACLSRLALAEVDGLDLGEADESILPLAEVADAEDSR